MGPGASKIYVSSYFFDRGMESSIIPNEDAISWDSHPAKYKEAAKQACSMSVEQVHKVYPKVQPDHAPYFCLDLSYAYSMLVNGFKIPEDAPMTIVSQITYKVRAWGAIPMPMLVSRLGVAWLSDFRPLTQRCCEADEPRETASEN